MALNREKPHLIVLPEDDATRSLAVGFSDGARGQMQILRPAGGWPDVLSQFIKKHAHELRTYRLRHMVLLIDFDDEFPDRLNQFKELIPPDVSDRVYVLGALDEAEDLKRETSMKLGRLGQALAEECDQEISNLWTNKQLEHNLAEIKRMRDSVKPFLF